MTLWGCRRAEIEVETPLKIQAYVQRDNATVESYTEISRQTRGRQEAIQKCVQMDNSMMESYTEIYPDRQGGDRKPYSSGPGMWDAPLYAKILTFG